VTRRLQKALRLLHLGVKNHAAADGNFHASR
jgi:hypothetical protein